MTNIQPIYLDVRTEIIPSLITPKQYIVCGFYQRRELEMLYSTRYMSVICILNPDTFYIVHSH